MMKFFLLLSLMICYDVYGQPQAIPADPVEAPAAPQLAAAVSATLQQGPLLQQVATLKSAVDRIKNHDNADNIAHCYDEEFNDQNLSIFDNDVHEVVTGYFNSHHESDNLFSSSSNEQLQLHSNALLGSIHNILKNVEECIELPEDKRSKYGLTSLSYMTPQQYKEFLTHSDIRNNVRLAQSFNGNASDGDNVNLQDRNAWCEEINDQRSIPSSFNWADKNMVTPVRDQARCGSCFIFASIAVVEGAFLISQQGKVQPDDVDFSEQAILNCLGPDTCQTGGWPDMAWDEMINNNIIDESEQPYQGEVCDCVEPPANRYNAKVKNYCFKNDNSDEDVQLHLLKYGPVFAALNADSFQNLRGPFNGYCSDQVNHAITITGWTEDYWIIKNSWTSSWGNDGYLYLARDGNKCGILSYLGVVEMDS